MCKVTPRTSGYTFNISDEGGRVKLVVEFDGDLVAQIGLTPEEVAALSEALSVHAVAAYLDGDDLDIEFLPDDDDLAGAA